MRSLLRGVVASIVGLLLLSLVLLSLMPLTETGTRWLLSRLGDFTPLTIEYDNGTVLGGLYLHTVSLSLDGLDVNLEDLAVALNPGCLWNSRVCLTTLSAHRVEVHVRDSGQEPPAADPGAFAESFEFPVAVSATDVSLDALLVTWPGGSWRSQRLSGIVNIFDEQLQVDQVQFEDGHFEIEETTAEAGGYPLLLPDIELPFTLVVDALQLTRGSYALSGQTGEFASLTLAGEWSGYTVALESLALATQQAELDMAGSLRMRESWWLQASAAVIMAQPLPSDPLALNRLTVNLEGAFGQLGWDAVLDSTEPVSNLPPVAIQLGGEVDVTQDQLPFSAQWQAQWQGDLPVGALLPGVALMESMSLRSPIRGSVVGNLQQQRLLADLRASGLGYNALEMSLQASLAASQLVIESFALADESSSTALNASGAVSFKEGVGIALNIESRGLQLPKIANALSGRVEGALTLSGSIDSDQWRLSLADVALQGLVNELPAELTGALSLSSERLLASASLVGKLNGGLVRLHSDGGEQSLGTLELQVDDIGLWIPDAGGALKLVATADPQATRLTIAGEGQELGYGSARLRSANFDGALALERQWFETVSLQGTQLDLAGQRIEDWQVEMQHDATSGADTLSITTRGDVVLALTLQGKGDLTSWKGALQPTEIAFSRSTLSLEQAVGLQWASTDDQLTVTPHCWRLKDTVMCFEEARLGTSGLVNGRVDGDLRFIADLLPQEVTVDGTLRGRLAARWSPEATPVLQLNLTGSDMAVTQNLGAGQLAHLDWNLVQVDLTTEADESTLQLKVERAGQSRLGLNARMSGWDNDARLSGSLEAKNLLLDNVRPFVPRMAELAGKVSGRGQLSGTLDRPELRGSFALEQGTIAVVGNPTTLSDLSLALELKGREAVLSGAGVVGEGALVLSGLAALDPQPSLTLNVKGDRQNLLVPPSGQALVSQDLALVATPSGVELKGNITVHEGRLEHEQLPEGSVDVSSDAVEVDYAGNVLREERPFDLTMDVDVKIEDRFRVIGTNIDTTVGGDLRLRQRSREPLELFGNLTVIGGELRAYGQSLKIKRGTVSFAGAADNPQLNLRADRQITLEDIEVGIRVIGPLEEPELEIYSNPTMSQTEALSYLLRGRGLDAGAGGDGAAVALSMGTSIVNQSGITDSLNKIPGVNNIGFGAEGSADETAATVSGYIGERIYVSYGVGVYEPINILTARLYLQARLWLEVVSRLENSIDVYYSFDID